MVIVITNRFTGNEIQFPDFPLADEYIQSHDPLNWVVSIRTNGRVRARHCQFCGRPANRLAIRRHDEKEINVCSPCATICRSSRLWIVP